MQGGIMADDNILESLGACGLNCEKCFAHVNGNIRKYSLKLKEKLGNFDSYAKKVLRHNMLKQKINQGIDQSRNHK
jgi:cytochrome c